MDKTLIIAEAGVNHNGSLEIAKRLIDAAAEAGADYVKFQTFKTEKLVSKSAKKADYQIVNTGDGNDSQFSMLKKLELSEQDHQVLIEYCRQRNIRFFSTAFDLESLEFLNTLGMDLFKIPSGEITNLPYLKRISKFGKPVILSTGMATMEEIKAAVDVLQGGGVKKTDICILHCNTEYPTPFSDVNLRAMLTISKQFNVSVGYSDHTVGIEVPVAAVALGARVIEKHFTLDRFLEGPDHLASLEPAELKQMVSAIRNIEQSLGTDTKQPSPSEIKNIAIARKSIHIARELPKGHILQENDLIMMRPGDGISPMRMDEIIGRQIINDMEYQHKLLFEDLL